MRRLVGASAVFACGALLRVPAFTRALLSDDEAIYAATAAALGPGQLLYRDVVDHKPPLIYHLYQAGFALLGPGHAHGAHLLVLLAVLATGALLWKIAAADMAGASSPSVEPDVDRGQGALAGWGLPAVTAGLFLVFSTTWHDYDALAANCELFLLLPQAGAAWLLLRALRQSSPAGSDQRGRWLAGQLAIGVLIGLSALCKYQGMTFLGVSAGLLAWAVRGGRLSWLQAGLALLIQLGAALLPAAAYLAMCAAQGNAQAAVDWFLFNFSYVGAGLSGLQAAQRGLWRLLLIGGVALAVYGPGLWGATRVIGRVGRGLDVADRDLLALLWLGTSAIAVAAGGRFFGHYFHLLLPPLCLLAGPRFLALWRHGAGLRAALVALCVVPALLFFLLATWARPLAQAWDHRDPPYDEVAVRIAALSAPSERLFVWGNSPQLYLLAGRPLGSRFTFCNYMTGESPGTPTETGARDPKLSSLPIAWDMLFSDLETRRPALFVDAAAAGWDGYDKFPVARYPRLAAYLTAHYQKIDEIQGVVIYRRRS